MQTQQSEPKPDAADLAIAKDLADVRAKHEALVKAADDLHAEAERWRLTFEREPTADAYQNRAIFEQRAVNAQAAAAAYEQDVVVPVVGRQNALRRARDTNKLEAARTRISEMQIGAAAHFFAGIQCLQALVELMNAFDVERKASPAAGAVSLEPISVQLAQIQQRVEAVVPQVFGMEYLNHGNDGTVKAYINVPAKLPAGLVG